MRGLHGSPCQIGQAEKERNQSKSDIESIRSRRNGIRKKLGIASAAIIASIIVTVTAVVCAVIDPAYALE